MVIGSPGALPVRRAGGGADCGGQGGLIARGRLSRKKAQGKPRLIRKVSCASILNGGDPAALSAEDLQYLKRAAEVARSSDGEFQPHPNAGCVLVNQYGRIVSEAYQRAQGTTSAEVQAVRQAAGNAEGSTAYLNLEPGDCHGDDAAVKALLEGGVQRVVIGLKHPLPHLRHHAIRALSGGGMNVASLEDSCSHVDPEQVNEILLECLKANEALMHRTITKRPFSILKYAMTLDGKIATSTGHSAWVSTSVARKEVFHLRASSDAVIVGGQTVRRDNPRLTTRRDSGHAPTRILMSRTLDLPEDANLWDVSVAPTIVMTQMGARHSFQDFLREKGVEVIEFDFLTPGNVADYCYERGFMQCLWECGGELAAPAISQNVIHKIMAFVAPKIIGGVQAPTPCGDLGFVEMTQAVSVAETTFRQVGPDLMIEGYLPASGGLHFLHDSLKEMDDHATSSFALDRTGAPVITHVARQKASRRLSSHAGFYKAWDRWGSLSNFSPHAIWMFDEAGPTGQVAHPDDPGAREWPSVEHYYQAQKFAGVQSPEAEKVFQDIVKAPSPEEAARIGRSTARSMPHLVCPDWQQRQLEVMREALHAKFTTHQGPREMLLETCDSDGGLDLMELSPHDYFWGCGADGSGQNNLGQLLVELRSKLWVQQSIEVSSS